MDHPPLHQDQEEVAGSRGRMLYSDKPTTMIMAVEGFIMDEIRTMIQGSLFHDNSSSRWWRW
jgi:hypothetical protein